MPAKLERRLRKVRGKKGIKSAYAICVKATGIKRKAGGGWTKGKKKKKKRSKRK